MLNCNLPKSTQLLISLVVQSKQVPLLVVVSIVVRLSAHVVNLCGDLNFVVMLYFVLMICWLIFQVDEVGLLSPQASRVEHADV